MPSLWDARNRPMQYLHIHTTNYRESVTVTGKTNFWYLIGVSHVVSPGVVGR